MLKNFEIKTNIENMKKRIENKHVAYEIKKKY
jgi:hypothetical protein